MQLLEEFPEVMLNMGQAVPFNTVNRNVSKTVAALTVPQKHWYRQILAESAHPSKSAV